MWNQAIGNAAGISQQVFDIFQRHANEDMLKDGTAGFSCTPFFAHNSGETGRMIEVDLPRTFPELHLFDSTGMEAGFVV